MHQSGPNSKPAKMRSSQLAKTCAKHKQTHTTKNTQANLTSWWMPRASQKALNCCSRHTLSSHGNHRLEIHVSWFGQFEYAPLVIDEFAVIGSRCGPMNQALELLAQGLPVTQYITKTFSLSQADEAIRCAADKSTMKVQIICNEE